jgi:hypothetical protein
VFGVGVQLSCEPDGPVDEVPCLRPRWPCVVFGVVVAVGPVAGTGPVLTTGALCSGDGAGPSPVCAKADGRVIARAIAKMQVKVFVTVPPQRSMIGRPSFRPCLALRAPNRVYPRQASIESLHIDCWARDAGFRPGMFVQRQAYALPSVSSRTLLSLHARHHPPVTGVLFSAIRTSLPRRRERRQRAARASSSRTSGSTVPPLP